jgi:hypothetical protein
MLSAGASPPVAVVSVPPDAPVVVDSVESSPPHAVNVTAQATSTSTSARSNQLVDPFADFDIPMPTPYGCLRITVTLCVRFTV